MSTPRPPGRHPSDQDAQSNERLGLMVWCPPPAASSRVEVRVGQVGNVQHGTGGEIVSSLDQQVVIGHAKRGVRMAQSPTAVPSLVPGASPGFRRSSFRSMILWR
jgi:hypothetical protein